MLAGETDNAVVQSPAVEAPAPISEVAQAAPEVDTATKSEPAHVESASVGVKTLYTWVDWLERNQADLPTDHAAFKKDAIVVLVYAYQCGTKQTCVLLKLQSDMSTTIRKLGEVIQSGESQIRDFREWEHDFTTVKAKFLADGWTEVTRKESRQVQTAQSEGGSHAQPALI